MSPSRIVATRGLPQRLAGPPGAHEPGFREVVGFGERKILDSHRNPVKSMAEEYGGKAGADSLGPGRDGAVRSALEWP
jgi:hypothetical protein